MFENKVAIQKRFGVNIYRVTPRRFFVLDLVLQQAWLIFSACRNWLALSIEFFLDLLRYAENRK